MRLTKHRWNRSDQNQTRLEVGVSLHQSISVYMTMGSTHMNRYLIIWVPQSFQILWPGPAHLEIQSCPNNKKNREPTFFTFCEKGEKRRQIDGRWQPLADSIRSRFLADPIRS